MENPGELVSRFGLVLLAATADDAGKLVLFGASRYFRLKSYELYLDSWGSECDCGPSHNTYWSIQIVCVVRES